MLIKLDTLSIQGFLTRLVSPLAPAGGPLVQKNRKVCVSWALAGVFAGSSPKITGFTLIELMVTVALAAIILTLAVPSFVGTIRDNRLVTQVNEMVSALNVTRSEAIKRGMQVTMCRSLDGTNCNTAACDTTSGNNCWEKGWVIFADANANGTLDSGETLISVHGAFTSGATIRSATNFTDWIAYLSTGTSKGNGNNANGMFNVCDSRGVDKAKFIIINSTGRIRVSSNQTGFTCP